MSNTQPKRRGSAPGERRGGRKKGTLNKVTAELKTIARQYAPQAMVELARLAQHAGSEVARVAAIKEIFDRGYGKAPQAMEHSGPNGGPIQHQHSGDIGLAAVLAKHKVDGDG